jgi:hypothetical protein
MLRKWLPAISAVSIVGILLVGSAFAAEPNTAKVCRQGGAWSDHQAPPLQEQEDAVEYCVKGGSSESQGCNGYLEQGSFEEVSDIVEAHGACGLSHWSYRTGATKTPDPTKTPLPTATPTVTEDPCEENPEQCLTGTPTVTEDPCEENPEQCLTATPTRRPTRPPETGAGEEFPLIPVLVLGGLLFGAMALVRRKSSGA